MKLLLALTALMLSSISAFATITINLGAAELFQSDGTTPIPSGSLLQLVASTTDSVFTTPSPSSFTGGSADDVVVSSFGSNNNAGPGSFAGPIVFTLSGNLTAGDPLMLRWWPTLTTGSSSPGFSTPFGQFRTDAVENSSDTGWFVPADGSTISLNFLDIAGGGTEPNSAGAASFMTAAAIPEPSTLACLMLGGGALFLAVRRRAND
jgi:hypothetical protein